MIDSKNTILRCSLTNAQILTLHTTPVAIETFTASTSLGYLPWTMTISQPAQTTAFTIASPGRMEVYDEDGNIWFSMPWAGFADQATAQGRMLVANLKSVNAGNSVVYIRSQGALTLGTGSMRLNMEVEVEPLLFG